jgi:hypothetical protein
MASDYAPILQGMTFYIVMTVLVGALSIWLLAMGRSPSDDDTDYDDSSVAPVPYCLAAEDTAVGQAS